MKLKFIGVGGAFAPMSKGNSNILITADNGENLLVDCGTTAPYILIDELKMNFHDINALYISHCHADHCGGTEIFAFSRYFIPKRNGYGDKILPKLYMVKSLMKEFWEHTLRGGLESVGNKVNNLTDYFDCYPLNKNYAFKWNDMSFYPIQVPHIQSNFIPKYSYGLYIIVNKSVGVTRKIFITSDSCFCPDVVRHLYNNADTIFQDCETLKGMKSGVHAHYDDLNTLLTSEIKRKMHLYHYGDKIESVLSDGFLGFVEKGQEFEF
jgi:ribonuclease BN (tRNA processing enzyme)